MKIIDQHHPFFAKPWRRYGTALLPLFWGAFEVFAGDPGWGMLFIAAGAYAFYVLVITYPKA